MYADLETAHGWSGPAIRERGNPQRRRRNCNHPEYTCHYALGSSTSKTRTHAAINNELNFALGIPYRWIVHLRCSAAHYCRRV